MGQVVEQENLQGDACERMSTRANDSLPIILNTKEVCLFDLSAFCSIQKAYALLNLLCTMTVLFCLSLNFGQEVNLFNLSEASTFEMRIYI